jgi:glycosyltransferase involved in cell wall biosynthesis
MPPNPSKGNPPVTPRISVAHLSTYPHGGAGLAAGEIHRGLLAAGVDSRFFYRENQSQKLLDSSYFPLQQVLQNDAASETLGWASIAKWWRRKRRQPAVRRIIAHYERHLRDNERQTEVFSQAEMVQTTRLATDKVAPDLWHFHWTAFAFDWPSFFGSLPPDVPLVWTLHDQNPLTGGCHFAGGCDRYRMGCGQCPQLRGSHARDLSWHSFRIKQAALAGRPLHVVAPSRWLLEQAKTSPIFQQAKSFHHIPYGIDTTAWDTDPLPSAGVAGRLLPTILFGAEDLENERKGVRLAIHAVNDLVGMIRELQPPVAPDAKLLRLWTFGKKLSPTTIDMLDPSVVLKQWGFVADRDLQGRIYRAADVFWLPSLEDNQPQTALESMACGTPVVAFQVGGVPEIVRHLRTGWVVAPRDTQAMARATLALLSHRGRLERLANAGMQMARDEYSPHRQSQRYLELYHQILGYQRPLAKVHSKSTTSAVPRPQFIPLKVDGSTTADDPASFNV